MNRSASGPVPFWRFATGCLLGGLLAVAVLWGAVVVWRTPSTAPCRAPDGSKWRVACYEGGKWPDYLIHMRAVARELMNRGWIEPARFPDLQSPDDTRGLWHWLATETRSDYIDFVEDAFWSADWDNDKRVIVRKRVIERLNHSDIDMIFAMGTWAGKDLATNAHHVPTIVMSASNPVLAGIIQSPENSGLPHLHAACDPKRFERQVRAFHRLTDFKRIGVVYEDTSSGRTWANLNELHTVGEERGFEVLARPIAEIGRPVDEAVADLRKAYAEMAPQIDALWVSSLQGEEPAYLFESLAPMFRHKVKVWSMWGPAHASRGALFTTNRDDSATVDELYVRTIAAVFHGAHPGDLPQVYKDDRSIIVNTEVARRIGYRIPPGALAIAAAVVRQVGPMRSEGAP